MRWKLVEVHSPLARVLCALLCCDSISVFGCPLAASAIACFDGRNSIELERGDWVEVTGAEYPVPMVTKGGSTADWISSITRKLHWNIRERQKGFERQCPTPGGGHVMRAPPTDEVPVVPVRGVQSSRASPAPSNVSDSSSVAPPSSRS